MNITFLGIAGNLGMLSRCEHLSGGIIIREDDEQLHIDPGIGALINARKYNINLRENTAILVSSSDLDRCNELNAVISAMTHDGLDPKGVLIINQNNKFLLESHQKFLEKTLISEPDKKFGIEEFTITSLRTTHPERLGYKIEINDVVIIYSGDTDYSDHVVDQYLRSHVLILNVPNSFGQKGNGLNSDDAVKILKKIRPDVAVITNFGKSILQSTALYEAREMQKQSKVSVLAAQEGMRIDPTSYLGENRQRILQFIAKKANE